MKIKDVIGVTVFAILIFGIIIGIYFLGFAGVSNLFGIQYDSLSSLGIFVISVFIIGFFVELIFDSLTILDVEKMVNYYIAFLVQFLFMFISEWIVIAIVEAVMNSDSLPEKTLLLLAALLALLSTIFDKKKRKMEKSTKDIFIVLFIN